jgi:hypothetical protein
MDAAQLRMPAMATCYLVSCVSLKAPGPLPAEVLYVSDWFTKARAYVLAHLRPGDQWFILSAEHQLLEPSRLVALTKRAWPECQKLHEPNGTKR